MASGLRACGARGAGLAPAGGAPAGFGIEQGVEPGNGVFVVFPPPAYVAHPGGEIRHGDQLVVQPGKVGDQFPAQNAGLAFKADAQDWAASIGALSHGFTCLFSH